MPQTASDAETIFIFSHPTSTRTCCGSISFCCFAHGQAADCPAPRDGLPSGRQACLTTCGTNRPGCAAHDQTEAWQTTVKPGNAVWQPIRGRHPDANGQTTVFGINIINNPNVKTVNGVQHTQPAESQLITKQAVLSCKTGHIAVQKGSFRKTKRPFSHSYPAGTKKRRAG